MLKCILHKTYFASYQIIYSTHNSNLLAGKAKKCYFGYAEIDFVGKVLSEKGLQMSQTKIRSVLDFPKPVIAKQLKSFFWFVNYFRDFIRNQSSLVHPLHQLLLNYSKTKKIVWTLEADACFDLVQSETAKCTTMRFLNDHAPISLQTDAYDYGVGGYLFQVIDGKEIPIAFISKFYLRLNSVGLLYRKRHMLYTIRARI